MLKQILHKLLTLIYRIEVKGLDNYKKAGDKILIVVNHTSFLDPLLLWVFLPDDITFAINTQVSQRWWLKPFLSLSRVIRIDPTNPLSLKALVHDLQNKTKMVIFPEGRITVTGSLMKIYDGAGMVADKTQATILPVRIRGAKYTHFSKLKNIVRLRLFPKITLEILPHTSIEVDQTLKGKSRRKYCGRILAGIMREMMFVTSNYRQTIFSALLDARTIHGGKHTVAEDLERIKQSYDALIARTICLANIVKKITEPKENIGVLLPNSTKTLNVILGLQLYNRIPAMLNYSIGSTGMISACKTACVKTVLTSRRFITLGKLEVDVQALAEHINLIYLEDLAKDITCVDKIKSVFLSKTANYWYKRQYHDSNSAAVVLFTSGSEGEPKGVVLSHANILANHNQLKACINFNTQDVVLNFLPMFHSFGFSVGTLLPILNGMSTFFYPSPLHYGIIPEMAYDLRATIMFGTNTFLAAYAKKAHAYDFYNMRYVVAGAEKLQDSTRDLWIEKFGIRILEGYGATETSPVLSANTPMNFKAGTVGIFVPNIQFKLEKNGKLHVHGPNIMLGYLLPENPGKLVIPKSIFGQGWYDTCDIVHIDEEGFISIKGRSKRFAKVSGEMISLAAVEQLANKAWPNTQNVAANLPDAQKGEQVVLLTTQKSADKKQLANFAVGIRPIGLPKRIFVVNSIPMLVTGKINYSEVNKLAAILVK